MNYKLRKQLNEDVTNNSFEEKVAEVKQQLQNGADPKDVFDNVGNFREGFARVTLGSKYNFIGTNNKILRDDLWFDEAYKFREGFARVCKNDKWNFIKPDGNFLREDLWFPWAAGFYNGIADVIFDGRECYLDTKGNLYDLDGKPINNVTENRRRVVRITESQLRNTIKRVVTQYLNESKRR